jgi:hypothetical protein
VGEGYLLDQLFGVSRGASTAFPLHFALCTLHFAGNFLRLRGWLVRRVCAVPRLAVSCGRVHTQLHDDPPQIAKLRICQLALEPSLTRPQHTLEAYPFTAPRVDLLEEQIQRHVESMTYEHVSGFMTFRRRVQCWALGVRRCARALGADVCLARQAPGAMWSRADYEDDPDPACRRE